MMKYPKEIISLFIRYLADIPYRLTSKLRTLSQTGDSNHTSSTKVLSQHRRSGFTAITAILFGLFLLTCQSIRGINGEYTDDLLYSPPEVESVSQEKRQWNLYPLDSLYHKPDDLFPAILQKTADYPHLVDWYIPGESSNYQLPIYAFRITNKEINKPKPALLFHGQHHAEEVIGLEIVMYMSNYLLKQYGHNDFISHLIDNYELWFVPTSNPEGFQVVNSGEYRLKRKNETDTNFNGIREVHLDGVDLNRNYDINWHEDTATNPESPYFKGYEPACQAETRTMQDFYEERRFNYAIFYHSSATGAYSERIFFPWRWGDYYSPDYREMQRLARVLASNLERNYLEGNYHVHQLNTSQRGFARDYIYSRHNTLSMLVEVGGNSPYGEGILNPPNDVLVELMEMHTQAMLQLLKEYDRNLLTIQTLDINDRPLAHTTVLIDGKESEHKNSLTTCKDGYLFYYLLPREKPYNLHIGDEIFTVSKPKSRNRNIVLKLGKELKATDPIERINNGEAIVMTNPVFQYFPQLAVDNQIIASKNPQQAFISLLDRHRVAYRQRINIRNKRIEMPWIPIDALKKGILSIQYRDVSPLADMQKTANRIIFLNDDQEVLSYCIDKSNIDTYYFHPHTQIGLDYSLYPAGDNNYLIEEVRVYGKIDNPESRLEISLYDGAEPIAKMLANYHSESSNGSYFKYSFAESVKLPNNLYVVLTNNSLHTIALARDKFDNVNSQRSFVYSSFRQQLQGADIAVELILEKSIAQ